MVSLLTYTYIVVLALHPLLPFHIPLPLPFFSQLAPLYLCVFFRRPIGLPTGAQAPHPRLHG